MARPAHKRVHAPCPNGVFNWSDCDTAVAHQWGKCKALVGKHDPEQCSNWAVSEVGWCGQHYASAIESEAAAKRIAIERETINERIDSYIEWVAKHPSIHDTQSGRKMTTQAQSTRGLKGITMEQLMAAGGGLEPPTSRVTADRSTTELPRKGPHRLTELA